MEKRESTKIGFRMWKSGKRWLFSGIALAATLMIGTSAISADVNVDGALTDHKDICLKVHDLHNEDEDKHQCVFWYNEEPTDKGPHRDEVGTPSQPGSEGPERVEDMVLLGGPGGSTFHSSLYVEEGDRSPQVTQVGLSSVSHKSRPVPQAQSVNKGSSTHHLSPGSLQLPATKIILSATGVTILIAVGAFSIKKIWKK